ncbi:MAG: hypothetical protein ACI3W8_00470 [Oscillospiraceae bacterium]
MACFLVSAAEAAVVTAASKAAEKKAGEASCVHEAEKKVSFSRKLKWLSNMLWGGSALLAFEHVWHGEIVPWFPFLTAASNPTDMAEMLTEMGTVGVLMAVIITAVWGCMVLVTGAMEKKALGSGSAAR